MDVTPPGSATAAAPASSGSGNSGVVSSDFETFLKMLTTQLENQDPLNPVDSTDFAVQLATFSGVEQQVLTNDLLTELAAGLTTGGMAQYANWVGMEARVAAPAAYDGQPLTVIPSPEAQADTAQLVVYDTSGVELQRLDIATDGQPLSWSGLTSTGGPLPDGTYRFEVESFEAGTMIGRTQAEVYAAVAEAKLVDGKAMLVLASGAEVAADDVTALRSPGA